MSESSSVISRLSAALAGRYAIERELGAGGMATVYLALDLKHDRRVALKVLRPELASDLAADRFLREIKLAARLTHPHILPLFDSGEADGYLYFVMPVVEGESLRDRLKKVRQLGVEEALKIAIQVADALDYAHRHDVVHRDVKPENIMLHEGHAVVTDFGIGKAVVAAARETEALTHTGMVVGKPAYVSPDQAAGDADIDGRSDLYSFGCVLYEMLTGEQPFTGPTVQAILAKRFVHTPPSVAEARPLVPTRVSRAVARLLAPLPADRFATAAQLVAALQSDDAPASADSAMEEKSVAVLPFANISRDSENEHFADGITEEIINALSQLPGLRVAARTSSFAFKGKTDLGAISSIERLAFSDPWSEASFAGLLSGPRVRLTVADDGSVVVGYSVLMLALPDADLANLAVAPSARGRGVGRQLLTGVVATARGAGIEHVYLEVRQSNARAIALYESAGFRAFSVRRRYYTDPVEDARVLRLVLSRE